jgi:hypothetical protein
MVRVAWVQSGVVVYLPGDFGKVSKKVRLRAEDANNERVWRRHSCNDEASEVIHRTIGGGIGATHFDATIRPGSYIWIRDDSSQQKLQIVPSRLKNYMHNSVHMDDSCAARRSRRCKLFALLCPPFSAVGRVVTARDCARLIADALCTAWWIFAHGRFPLHEGALTIQKGREFAESSAALFSMRLRHERP